VNILFTFRIFNNFRLPWKQSFPWNFSPYWIYFLLFRIFEQRRLPWKKKQSCPEIFHCIEYTSHIQEFWATCVCPEKQRGPWIHSTEYFFYYSGFFSPEYFFYYSGFLSPLPWKISNAGVRPPPPTSRLVCLWIQGLASTDVDLFDSNILKGKQVAALWFIMSVMLVKAMSGVGGAAMITSQGA